MINDTSFDFELLNQAPYGAYAVDLSQRILFWNRAAERILGHRADRVVGQPCHQVIQSQAVRGQTPVCMVDCPSVRCAKTGAVPSVFRVSVLCASGRRREVTVTPLVLRGTESHEPVLVHLFHELIDEARAGELAHAVQDVLAATPTRLMSPGLSPTPNSSGGVHLTRRELDVLRLLALGLDTTEVADELTVSSHTVRNHVRNAREKLHVRDRLGAVLAAMRRGLL